jgi:hypothetical protein
MDKKSFKQGVNKIIERNYDNGTIITFGARPNDNRPVMDMDCSISNSSIAPLALAMFIVHNREMYDAAFEILAGFNNTMNSFKESGKPMEEKEFVEFVTKQMEGETNFKLTKDEIEEMYKFHYGG